RSCIVYTKRNAAQLTRPSVSPSRLQCRRTPRRSSSSNFGTRRRLIDDALEQVPLDRAKGGRWHGLAWFRQGGVPGRVERSGAVCLCDPLIEIAGQHGVHGEAHIGKAVAAVIGRDAGILARFVGEQVEMRLHAGHRVDLAAELRHEEGVHDGRRGKPELHRGSGRYHQAKARVVMMTGTTTTSMIAKELISTSRSAAAIGPCGSNTPTGRQAATNSATPTSTNRYNRERASGNRIQLVLSARYWS